MRSKPYVSVVCDECECAMEVPLDEGAEAVMAAGSWRVVDGKDLCDECSPIEVSCDRCDTFGGEKTYANQACLPLNGQIVCVDWCIHHIVAALNAAGIETVASCCGHGKQDGRIDLSDGRVLIIQTAGETVA